MSNNIACDRIEYANEEELLSELRRNLEVPGNVEKAAEYLFQSLIDEIALGVAFEIHHNLKTGFYFYGNLSQDLLKWPLYRITGVTAAVEGEVEEADIFQLIDLPNVDVFGTANVKKAFDCVCPNCDRLVSANRFAPHLEKCMGMGRAMGRKASRRIASTRDTGNYYASAISAISDDEDEDWQGEKKKKKLASMRANGSKKNGKT